MSSALRTVSVTVSVTGRSATTLPASNKVVPDLSSLHKPASLQDLCRTSRGIQGQGRRGHHAQSYFLALRERHLAQALAAPASLSYAKLTPKESI